LTGSKKAKIYFVVKLPGKCPVGGHKKNPGLEDRVQNIRGLGNTYSMPFRRGVKSHDCFGFG